MFKQIKDFPEYYISDIGEVTHHDVYLTIGRFNTGYARVVISKDGKPYSKSVHRLVAEAFIPNPENKPTVNHKDANKLNNSVDNLEWATWKENMTHAIAHNLITRVKKQVECVETGELFESCTAAALSKGVQDCSSIAKCLKGKAQTAYGFHWKERR